jgi:glycosyltransferase involved in cell wall biosynthesis
MCTYNGGRYVQAQLQSIAAQTRPPDELIICDDGSDDDTADIIRAVVASSGLSARLLVNRERLGWTKNFEQAISLCEGDIIALADQDDVWYPTKLARLEAAFAGDPGVGAVITDAEVVDDQLRPLGYRLWQTLRFDRSEQQRAAKGRFIEVLLKRNVATGATMAFRAQFKPLILPIPSAWREDAHDAWIALLIAAVADVAIIDEPLVQYRQHPRQQIGGRRQTVAQRLSAMRADFAAYSTQAHSNCAAALTRFTLARDRLLAEGNLAENGRAMSQLRAKIDHFHARAELPRSRWARLPIVTRELLCRRYRRYSQGLFSVAQDLLR